MSGTEWLSEGAEDFLAAYSDTQPLLDLVIVGSGYGGAVAAARLAGHRTADGRPLDVVVLERGREYVPGDFPRRFADLPGHVRISNEQDPAPVGARDGLFDVRAGAEVAALVGNGLGGGSLINAGVMAEPTPEVFDARWPRSLRDPEVWRPYYARVREMLGARRMPLPSASERSPYAKPAKLAALEVLGTVLDHQDTDRRAEVAVSFAPGTSPGGVRQQACLQCGDCFTGCNHWAKNTLAMNYLPYARSRGARLVTGLTVLSLSGKDGDWWLDVTLTDRALAEKYMDKSTLPPVLRGRLRIRARRVILAAGTYGSTEILLRSRAALPLSRRVGEGYSTNGDMIAAGFKLRTLVNACGDEAQPPGSRNVGPTIAGMLDLRAGRPLHEQIAIEEMAAPAALRRMLEETVTNLGALHALARMDLSRHQVSQIAADPAAIDRAAVDRTALYAVMGHDDASGRLELLPAALAADDGGGNNARLSDGAVRVTRGDAKRAIAEHPIFQYGVDRLRAAHEDPRLAGMLLPNPLWDAWPRELADLFARPPRKGLALTVHPLGGCGMGDDAERGAVNHLGQVYSGESGDAVYDTLVVLDGAVVPTSLGINPALTIAAIAERASDLLREIWRLDARDETPAPLPEPPADPVRPAAVATARPTAFRFSERLTGEGLCIPLSVPGSRIPYEWYRFARATLHLEFTPVPDMMAFLATHPKVMTADEASLNLTLDGGGTLTVPLKGYMSLLEREDSTRWCRIARALWAWLLNRGLRDIWLAAAKAFEPKPKSNGPRVSLRQRITQLLALASHAGERRRYRYEFTVTRDIQMDGEQLFRAGDRLIGEKHIAYVWRGNLWRQWMDMELHVAPAGRRGRHHLGGMSVDLPYYVHRHAMQMQLTDQDSQPQALADFLSFATYTVRVFSKIHVWSLRAPEYPDSLADTNENTDKWTLRERFARLPGPVLGAHRSAIDTGGKSFLLHRYDPEGAVNDHGPVLLVHGFGASGSSFTLPTVDESLVGHLTRQGFVTWVVDLRTSIALRSSGQEWAFEEVAREDIAGAIEQVYRAGGQSVNVVAHCIGAAMFCMAALEGSIHRQWIRSVVLSQLGPLVELTPMNVFRGHVAGYLKQLLRMDELDVTARRTPFMEVVDRLLSTYPYAREEWFCHQPMRPWKSVRHEVFCNRASTIYNPLFEHDNINQATLDAFGDLIGHVNMRTYIQTLYFATQKRITDVLGRNQFVTQDNIAAHLSFPICFLHGEKNQLFLPATSVKSHELVSRVLGGERHRTTAADGEAGYQLEIVPGYGHQDCIIGKDAARDVFPRISTYLAKAPRQDITAAERHCVVRAARLGPILGWTRRDADGRRRVALSFVPDTDLSEPLFAVTLVLQHGMPVPGFCRRHELQRVSTAGPSAPPPRRVDVELPEGDTLAVVVASLHHEPVPERALPETLLTDTDLSDHAHLLLSYLGVSAASMHSLASDARLVDARYDSAPSAVLLDAAVLASLDAAPPRLTFATGSCRYTPVTIDRELADRTYGRLRQRLDSTHPDDLKPQLLLLTGDQIYADAYAGIFDPTSSLDRYDNQYREAWSAPNMRELLSRLPTYMMLDDHEIRNNWEAGVTDPDLKAALPAFQAYALLNAPPNPSGPRARSRRPFRHWYEFTAGGQPFFVLDTRTERHHGLSSEQGIYDDMLGAAQWNDLTRWLAQRDPIQPKFIVSPSVVAPWSRASRGSAANAVRADAWDGFPHSLNRLLGMIARAGQQNVVFVSGDYHCSMVCDLELTAGGRTVRAFSLVSSGIYAPFPFVNGSPAEFALSFEGEHTDWVRNAGRVKARLDPLHIRYAARPASFVTSASIAVVDVHAGRGDMVVEFLTDDGVVRESLVLAGSPATLTA